MDNNRIITDRFFYLSSLVEACIRGRHSFPADMASELKLLLQIIDIPEGSEDDQAKYNAIIDYISSPDFRSQTSKRGATTENENGRDRATI